MKYGYWVDLAGKQYGDVTWVHALPVGSFEHPVYGTMDFTPERIGRFAASVKNRVRGIDPDVDYDHKEHSGQAAGWVKDADARSDGLYLQVEWTPRAADAIKAGEYRYFSPEFDDEWTDASGAKHEDVLFGGALTNRPFLKNLLPVNLSEITAKKANEGGQMEPEQILALLGLGTDATEDQVKAAIEGLKAPPPPPPPPPPTPEPEPVLTGAALSEAIAKALAEHPALIELQRTVAETRRAQTFAETQARLQRIVATQGGRQYVMPPSVIDAIAEGSALTDPMAMAKKFVDAVEAFGRTGYVELGERGRTMNGGEKSTTQQLQEAVTLARQQHFQATGKQLSIAEATAAVVRNNPELYMAYRQESYAGREE